MGGETYQVTGRKLCRKKNANESGEGRTVPVIPEWKAVLDRSVIVALTPLWLPLGLFCAGWIKLVSRGSVFFRQERVGFDGKPFEILKFRSMRAGADTRAHEAHLQNLIGNDQPMTKLDATDSRVILGGRILRATGLDELPQLINVWRGAMSIVGPRPCTVSELGKYKPCYSKRFRGLPGITGGWQVNGKNRTSFHRMVALDILYLRKANPWRDLLIMARTPMAILVQVNDLLVARRRAKRDRNRIRFSSPPPRLVKARPPQPRPIPQRSEPKELLETARYIIRKTQRLTNTQGWRIIPGGPHGGPHGGHSDPNNGSNS